MKCAHEWPLSERITNRRRGCKIQREREGFVNLNPTALGTPDNALTGKMMHNASGFEAEIGGHPATKFVVVVLSPDNEEATIQRDARLDGQART